MTGQSSRAFKALLHYSLTIRVRPLRDRSEGVPDIGSGWATIESFTPLMMGSFSSWWSLLDTDATFMSSQAAPSRQCLVADLLFRVSDTIVSDTINLRPMRFPVVATFSVRQSERRSLRVL